VVYDSTPEAERREALLKLRYATCDTPEFEVFETLGWTPGGGFRHLEKHVVRAAQSQRYFNREYIEGAVEEALEAKLPELSADPLFRGGACVKFRLDRNGAATVEISPPRKPDWRGLPLRLLLSRERTSVDDVYLHHKTTNRDFYDSRFAAACEAGFHEVVFMNTRGELTEGAVSNIFICKGGRWLTPSRDCGLLPGIWRAGRLAELNASECVITIADLLAADEVMIGNSLRGSGQAAEITGENGGIALWRARS